MKHDKKKDVTRDENSDRKVSETKRIKYDDYEREGSWTDWAESQSYSDDCGEVSLPETCWWER